MKKKIIYFKQPFFKQWSIHNSYIFSSFYFSTSSLLIYCWHLLGKPHRGYHHCRGRINFFPQNCTFSAFAFIRGFLALLLSPRREATQDRMIIWWQVWHLVQDFWMVQGSRFSLMKQRFTTVTCNKNAKDLSNPLSITLTLPPPSLHLTIGLP